MTRDEAIRLIEEKEGDMCVRLHRRSDGTVLTSDCPVGESASQRSQIARMFALFIGLATALFGTSYVTDNHSPETRDEVVSSETTPVMLGGMSPITVPESAQNSPLPQTEYHGNASGDAPGADITIH